MPLKPIYEKSPLMTLEALPLRPGQVSAKAEAIERLVVMAGDARKEPAMWEGLVRAQCVYTRKAQDLAVSAWIMEALENQAADGALGMPLEDSVCVMRAAFALYENDAKKPLLEKLLKWCAYLSAHMDEALECAAIRQQSADLMELLENIYRVSDKKAILPLCERLRHSCMDWSGILHTFAVQRPMARVTSWSDMEPGLAEENGNEQGFYTRQYLTCHGRHLADGARAAVANGRYSGNGMELTAAKAGWEKISRYHGAVCGGVTCDGMIGGTSPSACVDASALGAWAEALCLTGVNDKENWAWEALDVMLENAMAKATMGDKLNCLQRVNGLSADCGTYGTHHVEGDREEQAISRLLRGYAAAYSHAVTTRKNGVDVNLFLPGKYTAVVDGAPLTLDIACEGDKVNIKLSMKQDAKATVRIRMPQWAADGDVQCEASVKKTFDNTSTTLEGTWKNGDTITCAFYKALRTVSGHHQSKCVMLGSTLLAMPATADTAWAMALTGEPAVHEDGTVTCAAAPVTDWRRHGGVPADLPVLPKVVGEDVEVTLRPYAETCGIALFPKGTRA